MKATEKPKRPHRASLPLVGWREWISLPNFNLSRIKVKVDTGARTSALHVSNMKILSRSGRSWVYFDVHPLQHNSKKTVSAHAEIIDFRHIRSSSGHTSLRPVIETELSLGEHHWTTQITLVNRDLLGFRMLLGRRALKRRFLVDCSRSFILSGKKNKKRTTS